MEFEWDEGKNQSNIRKHGIGFDTAKRIFDGRVATSADRRRDYGEDRNISIGQVEVRSADRGRPHRAQGAYPSDLCPPGIAQGKENLP